MAPLLAHTPTVAQLSTLVLLRAEQDVGCTFASESLIDPDGGKHETPCSAAGETPEDVLPNRMSEERFEELVTSLTGWNVI